LYNYLNSKGNYTYVLATDRIYAANQTLYINVYKAILADKGNQMALVCSNNIQDKKEILAIPLDCYHNLNNLKEMLRY
jgi:hypothetical protein